MPFFPGVISAAIAPQFSSNFNHFKIKICRTSENMKTTQKLGEKNQKNQEGKYFKTLNKIPTHCVEHV